MSIRLNYAVLASTLALVASGAGVGYAAASLPKNSVGTKQLQTEAVTSAKIAEGTVKRSDLAPGALPERGPAGPQGPAGLACDILCGESDLPAGVVATVIIDGVQVGSTAKAYDIHCPDSGMCTVRIGGPGAVHPDFWSWYQAVLSGSPTAARGATLNIVDNGTVTVRYFIEHAEPTEVGEKSNRWELTLTVQSVQRLQL